MNRLQFGLSNFFARVLKIERQLFFEKFLDVPNIKIEAKVDIDVEIVQCAEFSKVVDKFRTLDINVEKNYGSADLCAIVEIGERPVHIRGVKLNEANVESIERKIRISSDSAYLYGAYTVPEYRGLGVAPKVTEKIFHYLNQIGIRKVYACIRSDNSPSLRYADKVGYRKIGEVKYMKILKLRLYRFKGETKKDYNTLIRMFSIKYP